MLKRILKLVLTSVLGGILISPMLCADNSMPSLLSQFESADPVVRSNAFSLPRAKPAIEKQNAAY